MKITQNSKSKTLIQISQHNRGKSEDRAKMKKKNIASEEQLEVKIKKNEP